MPSGEYTGLDLQPDVEAPQGHPQVLLPISAKHRACSDVPPLLSLVEAHTTVPYIHYGPISPHSHDDCEPLAATNAANDIAQGQSRSHQW